MQNKEKLEELKEKLKDYEDKLAREMIGYRGVIHESAASEIKHSKVMVECHGQRIERRNRNCGENLTRRGFYKYHEIQKYN